MATVIRHNPDLTKEQLLPIFQEGFRGKYDVYLTKLPGADLVVKKSAITGIAMRLKQAPGETRLKYGAFVPSAGMRALGLGGLLWYVIMWFSSWKAMTDEVKAFIESSPELNGDAALPPVAAATVTGDSSSPPRHGIAAVWMGVTALVLPFVVAAFYGYFDLFVSTPLILAALFTAATAFGVSRLLHGKLNHDLARGVAIGTTSWLAGQLLVSAFFWGMGNEIASWFSMHGIFELALATGSGAGLALATAVKGQPVSMPDLCEGADRVESL